MASLQTNPEIIDNRRPNWMDNQSILAKVMIFPAFVYIIVLVGLPFLFAILLAFSDATVGSPYIDRFTLKTIQNVLRNPNFQISLWNTFFFSFVSQIIMVFLANILAVALSANFPGKWFVRLLILLPWATPIAVSAVAWQWLFEPTYSPLDWIFREIGILGKDGWLIQLGLIKEGLFNGDIQMLWFGRTVPARIGVIIMYVWRMLPMSTVIIMAGLTSIPGDVKDAVAVDGVSWWTEFTEVTLPLLRPILMVAFLFGLIFTFTDITLINLVTRGNPANDTQVLANQAYFVGIEGQNLAEGAATALFMLPVLLGVALVMLRIARRSEVN
jgi:multiple sugar transport system permease protein